LKFARRLGALLLCVFGAAAITIMFLWNGSRALALETRLYPLIASKTRECTLTIRAHRFRPITEFEFTRSPMIESHLIATPLALLRPMQSSGSSGFLKGPQFLLTILNIPQKCV